MNRVSFKLCLFLIVLLASMFAIAAVTAKTNEEDNEIIYGETEIEPVDLGNISFINTRNENESNECEEETTEEEVATEETTQEETTQEETTEEMTTQEETSETSTEAETEEIIEETKEQEEETTSSTKTYSGGYEFTDDEVYLIARITYLETGCQGKGYEYVTYLTACVILNRYLDWGYDSISDVIYAKGQYSTAYRYTDWGGGTLSINQVTWDAVYEALENTDRNPHYQSANYSLSGYGLTLYYDDGITQIYK